MPIAAAPSTTLHHQLPECHRVRELCMKCAESESRQNATACENCDNARREPKLPECDRVQKPCENVERDQNLLECDGVRHSVGEGVKAARMRPYARAAY